MYRLKKTKRFIKSYKKILSSGRLSNKIQIDLNEAIDLLLNSDTLPVRFRDHQLSGELREYRECHIRSDLLLVYRLLKNEMVIVLIDIGSHSYLFK